LEWAWSGEMPENVHSLFIDYDEKIIVLSMKEVIDLLRRHQRLASFG
jgi:hypothetical protein